MTDYTASHAVLAEQLCVSRTPPQYSVDNAGSFYDVMFEGTLELPLPWPRIIGEDGLAVPVAYARNPAYVELRMFHEGVLDASCGVFVGEMAWRSTAPAACIEGRPVMDGGRGIPVEWGAVKTPSCTP